MKLKLLLFSLSTIPFIVNAQDTFSIVALDSATRQVGSAGASCVDLANFGINDAGFLGELFPDSAAINSQAAYLEANQTNARTRIRLGDSPQEVIDWLVNNDVQNQPQTRQYGIVGFLGNQIEAAAHTGISTMGYSNHITGNKDGLYYSIQGNILLGQEILDDMENNFINTEGDLACKLMAAMQGANVVGADTRCAPNATSSLFAFLKVSEPSDLYGSPSFNISVITQNNQNIEPIDSLQVLFNLNGSCSTASLSNEDSTNLFSIKPNPVNDRLEVILNHENTNQKWYYSIQDITGKIIFNGELNQEIDVSTLSHGVYHLFLYGKNHQSLQVKFVKR